MRFSYSSPLLIATLAATLSACGSNSGNTTDTPVASATGMMASTRLASTTYAAGSTTWTPCAEENGKCSFSGTAEVRYGTATQYVTKTLTGPVACTNDVFGDPAPGYGKTCSLGTTPAATSTTPATWTVCAKEYGTCSVSGTAQVRYGTATQYVTKTVTGSVACINTVFGDPAPGYGKSCSVGTASATTTAPTTTAPTATAPTTTAPTTALSTSTSPTAWTVCATEDNTCSFSGTAQVRYGTATQYVTKILTGPVACTNAVFGDPAPNYGKACSIGIAGAATPVPTAPAPAPTPAPTPAPAPTAPTGISPAPVPAPTGGAITTVQLTNASTAAQANAAATFGQVFAQGDVRNGETLFGRTASGATVPLQVDAKARHPDGSLRHAVITVQLPNIAANQVDTISLAKGTGTASAAQTSPSALINNGFTASFNATIGGVRYTASADELLKSGKYTTWLSGSLVNEWLVQAPLKSASGVEHPHLMAQFAIRSYAGSNSARVDVTIENGWAFQASPQNFTYDAQMLVGGQSVYSQAALTHYHHARWRKVFWWGKAQALNVRHNTKYLIASKALPNYDQSLAIKDTTLAYWKSLWSASKNGPMQAGVGMAYMPTTGARSDIGPMPTWNALYLLSMDQRIKDVALGMSDAAGSWSAHYRDKNTGRPVTLAQYPYMSGITSSDDTINPVTRQKEAFPACPATLCTTPMTADTAHQAAFSFLPYLTTGDYYHLEELQFWANWSSFNGNPAYRQAGKGLVKPDQVRGQAWTLRTLAEAAYITPDNDPQKTNFTAIVNNNIDWYNATYTNNAGANKLGVLNHDSIVGYDQGLSVAPWQDDFFTASVGRMVELGFSTAQPLLAWKSRYVVDRMAGAGFCWVEAPLYSMKVRATPTSTLYTSIGQVYQANVTAAQALLSCGSAELAASLKLRVGEMVGDSSASGGQAIMQPALAYSVGANANGAKAWAQYAARPYKPDYAAEPQYAIVPR